MRLFVAHVVSEYGYEAHCWLSVAEKPSAQHGVSDIMPALCQLRVRNDWSSV